ncbi:MAG: DUF4190 domain-containing protein [Planctomycetaceae bacterium]|nr:DUF4190 domain-containing protein [Planctomycetaceae bacterium]
MTQEFDETISKITKEEISGKGITVGYRAVSVLAVIALVLSLFTPLMLLSNWFILFPLLGAICGIFGLYNILSCPFDYTGRGFALGGIIFSFVIGIAAAGWGTYLYYFNIPYGYTAVSFLEMRPDERTGRVPEHIMQLAQEQRKVYIRGFMYPGRQLSGIQNFILVRAKEHCKFCATQLNPFDMVSVHCTGELRVPFRTRAVHVGGVLYYNEDYHSNLGGVPFHIEADLFR